MNYTIIEKLSDLQSIMKQPICITNKNILTNEQIRLNMWAITFSDSFFSKIKINDFVDFFLQLLQQYQLQLLTQENKIGTFYLWFDEQALQLRFNLLPGFQQTLPFGCRVNKINSLDIILKKFISTMNQIITNCESIEFIEHDDNNAEDEYDNYTLDVYIKIINHE